MRNRLLAFAGAIAVAVAVAAPIAAQAPRRATPENYTPKRLADGHPDLQGVYDIATLTPLERANTLSEEDAKKSEDAQAARRQRAALPSDGTRQAPPVGGDGSTGASGNVGGYNNFWIDSGEKYVVIDGQRRDAIVVDPPNGRVPAAIRGGGGFGGGAGRGAGAGGRGAGRGGAAAAGAAPAIALPTSDAGENAAPTGRGAYDNIEQRPLSERCLLGFGSTSGPPALPVLYNNLKQIVQTRDHVMILNEMAHDARIVRMNQPHVPQNIRKWMGDSIGWWEGDTLVVETTNFTDKTRYRGATPNLKITERFKRLNDQTLLYRFTIDDPAVWEKPWTGEYAWPQAPPGDLLYEYACHEGNHAMGDILRGARILEKEAEAAAEPAGRR